MGWDFWLLATHVGRGEGGNFGWTEQATSRGHRPANVLDIAEFVWTMSYMVLWGVLMLSQPAALRIVGGSQGSQPDARQRNGNGETGRRGRMPGKGGERVVGDGR